MFSFRSPSQCDEVDEMTLYHQSFEKKALIRQSFQTIQSDELFV